MNDIFQISAVAIIAFASPIISERIGAPAVIVEIMAGFVLAYFLADLIRSEWFHFFSSIGLIFLMFLSGLEIDFSLLFKKIRQYWRVPLYVFLSLILSFVFVKVFNMATIYAVFLANVSLGIVMPVMREMNLVSTNFGQKILFATFLTDLITISLLSGIAIGYRVSGSYLELLLPAALVPLFVFAYHLGRYLIWHFPDFMARFFDDPMELGVRGSFAIMILFSGLAFILGSEAILGAFLAGSLVSLTFRGAGKLEESLMGIGYGIFIPFFFIKTGADMYFSISELTLTLPLVLLLAGFAVKLLPSAVFVREIGVRASLAFGTIQSSKLGLTLAGAEIARELGIISSGEAAGIALWTILSAFIFPVMFRKVVRD
ncbi:cation:proton antiporter [Geoglobus acetivorans]|uniref:Na /H antiporter (NapA-1) n=1 Tax=Geoglobus acetivorans TaxID=565033 RepID=A0A0A7GD21_GEOAI|nr:Na /H antiporter (napA-1) [Geoglobus acetivorans]